ncbi:toll interleukin-1 receptor domain-containing [Paramuricea clavata]|uniref:Toll interleukin-1 receptor domain-containing n=1 Tax=Paramuricea clavata TaxID=317549 RepID=A0A6S7IM04_PARCT|nr:toll interleukin-1 receptor domain-containing [Paramuricea clavata]
MDFSKIQVERLTTSLNESNIVILENRGLDGSSGSAVLKFKFDYELEKDIVANFKYNSTGDISIISTLEIEKCHYLRIKTKKDRVSFHIEDKLVNTIQLKRLQVCASNKKLKDYLETNVVPLITKKIKYTKFAPQFRFFLSHKAKDKPVMRTFEDGLTFLGYSTWIDESNMPMGAHLQQALKTSIDNCDCFVAWLNEEYFKSEYCTAELLYAKNRGKIILPFGVFSEIKTQLRADENLVFLEGLLISNPNEMSFFEALRRIDETLFNFEKMALPSS